MMAQELSGVTVVTIIAANVLLFILLFIFAKRQIMRFALRSRRGPHVPIGHGAKKDLKIEINRRIDVTSTIIYEPRLIQDKDSRYILPPGSQLPSSYYRLKACDDLKLLENEIIKQDSSLLRHPTENLRVYLLNTLSTPHNIVSQRLVHQFCDLYEHARHDPLDFRDDDYEVFSRILLKLLDAAKVLKSFGLSRKSIPPGTPPHGKGQENSEEVVDDKLNVTREETEVPVCDSEETSV